jgi:hypothetical protein
MLKFELKADQSFSKTNIFLDEEISSLASEEIMWLLLNDKDKIAGKGIGLNKIRITISLPSPLKTIAWPWKAPFSTGTSKVFSLVKIFLPAHPLHFAPSEIIYPYPLQASHAF